MMNYFEHFKISFFLRCEFLLLLDFTGVVKLVNDKSDVRVSGRNFSGGDNRFTLALGKVHFDVVVIAFIEQMNEIRLF